MNNLLSKLYVNLQQLITREDGQDLFEYALLIALVALALISSVSYVTTNLVIMFSNIGNSA